MVSNLIGEEVYQVHLIIHGSDKAAHGPDKAVHGPRIIVLLSHLTEENITVNPNKR